MARPTHHSTPSIRKPSIPLTRRRRSPTAHTLPPPLLFLLRILVVLLVLWYELGTFWWHTSSCHWDDSLPSSDGTSDGKTVGETTPFHVLVVADPQLLDMRSYPGRNGVLKWLGVKVTDAYARKAWSAYVHRFNRLFPLPRLASSSLTPSLSSPIPSILLAGNHDLGLHLPSASLASYARERFVASFGPVFGEKEWAGWSFVWVDSMALLEDEGGTEARAFVESLADRPSTLPRILLTHIPLYRPDGTPCGNDREHARPIYEGEGKNYRNELDKATSDWLLRSLKPTLVYSGDDHDACVVEHAFPSSPKVPAPASFAGSLIRESTIKAFSMAMGIHRPGYHLLSLSPSSPSYSQTTCVLPDQLSIWLSSYLTTSLILLVALLLPKLLHAFLHSRSVRHTSSALSNGLPLHKHKRSLSQKLFSPAPAHSSAFELSQANELGKNGGDFSSEDDEQDEHDQLQFPTFPFASPHVGYHSGLDSDDIPTSSVTSSAPHSPSRVRRVSRVWAWEDGSSPTLPTSYNRSRSGSDAAQLPLLGPLNRDYA
ncbi:hypothetical protein RQP46_010831 [Phenoliferia psychrophenolica]